MRFDQVNYFDTGRCRVRGCYRRMVWESILGPRHSSEEQSSPSDWLAVVTSQFVSSCGPTHQTRRVAPPPGTAKTDQSQDMKDVTSFRAQHLQQPEGSTLATFFLSWNSKLKIITNVALSTAARTAAVIKLTLQMEHVSNLLYLTYPKFQTHWSSCITGLTHYNFSL